MNYAMTGVCSFFLDKLKLFGHQIAPDLEKSYSIVTEWISFNLCINIIFVLT